VLTKLSQWHPSHFSFEFIHKTERTQQNPLQDAVGFGHFIIIGKTTPFEPWPSLEDSAINDPVFTSLDFATINFLHSKVVSLASKLQP
jgi:hypothetical protein